MRWVWNSPCRDLSGKRVFLLKDKPCILMKLSHRPFLQKILNLLCLPSHKIKAFSWWEFEKTIAKLTDLIPRLTVFSSLRQVLSFPFHGFKLFVLGFGCGYSPVSNHPSVDHIIVSSSTIGKLFCVQNKFHFKCCAVITNCLSFMKSNHNRSIIHLSLPSCLRRSFVSMKTLKYKLWRC